MKLYDLIPLCGIDALDSMRNLVWTMDGHSYPLIDRVRLAVGYHMRDRESDLNLRIEMYRTMTDRISDTTKATAKNPIYYAEFKLVTAQRLRRPSLVPLEFYLVVLTDDSIPIYERALYEGACRDLNR